MSCLTVVRHIFYHVHVNLNNMYFFYVYVDHRDLHVLTHSFPTRRSSDLSFARSGGSSATGALAGSRKRCHNFMLSSQNSCARAIVALSVKPGIVGSAGVSSSVCNPCSIIICYASPITQV